MGSPWGSTIRITSIRVSTAVVGDSFSGAFTPCSARAVVFVCLAAFGFGVSRVPESIFVTAAWAEGFFVTAVFVKRLFVVEDFAAPFFVPVCFETAGLSFVTTSCDFAGEDLPLAVAARPLGGGTVAEAIVDSGFLDATGLGGGTCWEVLVLA